MLHSSNLLVVNCDSSPTSCDNNCLLNTLNDGVLPNMFYVYRVDVQEDREEDEKQTMLITIDGALVVSQACAGYPTVTVSHIFTVIMIPARLERPIGAEKMKIHFFILFAAMGRGSHTCWHI
jgi:hypothetical protein